MPFHFRYLFLIPACLYSFSVTFAQDLNWACGTEAPAEPLTENFSLPQPDSFPPIPVVFHVIAGANGVGNIPNEWLDAEIQKLNGEYAGSGISFFLLGVSRTINSFWHEDFPSQAYISLHLDTNKILNVYIPSGNLYVSGASTFPGSSGSQGDGFWVGYQYISPPSNPERSDVSVHESGHYLGLLHTWGPVLSGGLQDCEDDDGVVDTPFQEGPNGSCPSGTNVQDTCPQPGYDPVHNFMNYTSFICTTEFTNGQVNRMKRMRRDYRSHLGVDLPIVLDERSGVATYVNPTFVSDSLYVLNGANVTISGTVTLDGQSNVVIVGDTDLSGVTAIHVRGGSRFEVRRHNDPLSLNLIEVEGGSTLEIGMQYADYDSEQRLLSVSDSVVVSGSSTFDTGKGTLFAGTGPLSISGGSAVSVAEWDSSSIGGAVSLTDESLLMLGSGSYTVAGGVDISGGSSLTINGEVTFEGDVTVSDANSELILDFFDRLILADQRSLRLTDQASWTARVGAVLQTGHASNVIMEADAGDVILPSQGPSVTFLLGEDSDLFFYNDGLTLVAGADSPLEIQPRDPALPWGSLYLYADSSTLDHVHIEGAAGAGLTVSAQDVLIRNTTVTGSGAGLYVMTDWEGGQSSVMVDNVLLSGNEYGVVARDAVVGLIGSTIENSARHGVHLLPYAHLDPFYTTVIGGSGSGSPFHGAVVHSGASLWTNNTESEPGAYNRIDGSSGDAVRVLSGGFAWLGDQTNQDPVTPDLQGHKNTLLRGPAPSSFAVNNLGSTLVPARGNY